MARKQKPETETKTYSDPSKTVVWSKLGNFDAEGRLFVEKTTEKED